MKYLPLALACSAIVTGCGGSDGLPVTPPAGLSGLWEATSAFEAKNPADTQPAPPNEMYILLENAAENPIDVGFYTLADTANCFEYEATTMTHIGNNKYENTFGESFNMTANANSLVLTVPVEDINLGINFKKSIGQSKADLPECGVQNDASTLLQDDAPGGLLLTIKTKLKQLL